MSVNPDSEKITICLGADRRFAFPLAVTLSSIRTSQVPDRCRVFIFGEGYDEQSRAAVEKSIDGPLDITWFDTKDFSLGSVRLPWPDVVTKATCFRLMMPSFLPPGTERIIYIDCDTVVCSSLEELWATPLAEEQFVGAVYDAFVPWAGAPSGTAWRELGLPPATPYFNAGVMVIPVARWLAEDIGPRAVKLMNERELIYMDQCALNALFCGRWRSVHPKWNLQTPHMNSWHFGWVLYGEKEMQEAFDAPAIIHYSSGDTKPWLSGKHELSHKWYQALDQTIWKGWRPVPAEDGANIILPQL